MTEDKKNTTGLPGPMDYDKLLEYGLAYIREIGTRHWTDFNAHDPGVTILEALTLALNDLSYRSSSAMADLLTRPGGKTPSLEGAMFPADVILPNAPTTADDYRKLVLENIPGIRNIWFNQVQHTIQIPKIPNKTTSASTTLSGYYNVLVELEDIDTMKDDPLILDVLKRDIDGKDCADHISPDNVEDLYRHCIRTLLLRHRNLCENFLDIQFMEPVEVGLCAEIEIDSDLDVRSILQDIYDRMFDYVSPAIPFHSVQELLSSGREADEVFSLETPRLGFIDADELRSFSRKTDLYASDAIGILMGIPGIKSIRHIHFISDERVPGMYTEFEGRHLRIEADGNLTFRMTPRFHRNRRLSRNLFVNNIIFQRSGLTFFPPEGPEGNISVQPREDEKKPLPAGFLTSLPLPAGAYRSTDRYFSFQNLFPTAYRMGVDTIPDTASALRKAERMQLKAYLAFFDQVLADYLAQLDRLQDLLALKEGDNHTYFHHRLRDDDVVDISQVLKGFPDYPVPPDNPQADLARKNSVLNHLLSRFADSFAEYTALEFVRKGYEDEFSLLECVEDKKRFLQDYPVISSRRSSGVDWTVSALRVSGAERRIMRKLGVNEPDKRKQLSKQNEMGLYLLEHNLLIPLSEDESFLQLESGKDRKRLLDNPYSFRVTAILPGWPELAGNLHYRKYVETIIREELPAHIFVKICWVSREVMAGLEKAYTSWHQMMFNGARFKVSSSWKKQHAKALDRMLDAFGQFANIYQMAVVMPDDTMDYVDDESITRLDFTYLGSEEYQDDSSEEEEKPQDQQPGDGQEQQTTGDGQEQQTTGDDQDQQPGDGQEQQTTGDGQEHTSGGGQEGQEGIVVPPQDEAPDPQAGVEDIQPVITALCDNGPRAIGALIGSAPQLLGSLIEGLRQDKETQH